MALTSCNFSDMPESVPAHTMHLSDYDVTVMVGDTVDVTCIFEPESATATKAFWDKKSPNIAIANPNGYTCRVIGAQPGDAWVYAVTLNDDLQDSCLVHVIERWDKGAFDHTDYEYDMVVIADVEIDGEHNNPAIATTAYVGSALGGYGEVRTSMGITYTYFRVYSRLNDGGKVTFRYYDAEHHRGGELDYTLKFDVNHHGTLTSPVILSNKSE